jgi:tetratricopeptide (TPR) repeat protein
MTIDFRRMTAAVALVAATTLAAAPAQAQCSPSELNTAQQSYSTAYQFVQANQWAEAIPSLEKAVEACPEHWESVELIAQAKMRTNSFTEAGDWYAKLIEGKYDGVLARVENRILAPYGFVLLKNRDWREAEKVYETVLTHDPANKDAHERLVYAYSNSDDLRNAIEHLEALYAMETGPKQQEIANRIGKAFETLGESVSAKQWYELGGGGSTGMFKIALDHFNQQEWQEAADAFRKFLDKRPESAAAWKNLGQSLQQLGKLQEAVDAYRKALELQPDRHDVASSLGFLYSDLNQWNKAAELAENALANWSDEVPEKDSMYFLMGKILEKRDANYREAIRMFEEAKDDPYWGELAVKEIDRQQQLIEIQQMQGGQGR